MVESFITRRTAKVKTDKLVAEKDRSESETHMEIWATPVARWHSLLYTLRLPWTYIHQATLLGHDVGRETVLSPAMLPSAGTGCANTSTCAGSISREDAMQHYKTFLCRNFS
jgi:hypothetical protein